MDGARGSIRAVATDGFAACVQHTVAPTQHTGGSMATHHKGPSPRRQTDLEIAREILDRYTRKYLSLYAGEYETRDNDPRIARVAAAVNEDRAAAGLEPL